MKLNTILLAATLMASSLLPQKSAALDIESKQVARISAPPAGKALINLHVTVAPFLMRTPIFDETCALVADLPTHSVAQIVCDPGVKSFFSQVQGGAGAIRVLSVDAAADKTYDLLFYKPNAKGAGSIYQYPEVVAQFKKIEKKEKDPTKAAAAKAAFVNKKLEGFQKGEGDRVYELIRNNSVTEYEARCRADMEERKRDFLQGSKTNRVVRVSKTDCR